MAFLSAVPAHATMADGKFMCTMKYPGTNKVNQRYAGVSQSIMDEPRRSAPWTMEECDDG
jgi:hypothetical protein